MTASPTHIRSLILPIRFLLEYQKNFRFLTFPTSSAVPVSDYKESVEFRALDHAIAPAQHCFGKIGGNPDWVSEDESPGTFAGNIPMVFIAEIYPGRQFGIHSIADRQIELDIRGKPAESRLNYYELFLGNALFLFGPVSGERLVYALTQ